MTTIKYRRGTAAQWTTANPILAVGEPGYESDTGKYKIGNGSSTWSALPYFLNKTQLDAIYAPIGSSGPGPGGIFVGDADDIPDGTGKVMMTTTERSKLNGIQPNATANALDSFLLDRANHYGDLLIADMPEVTDTGSLLMKAGTTSQARDAIQAFGPTVDNAPVMVVQYFTLASEPRLYGTSTDVSTVWRGPVEPTNRLAGDSWEILL